MGTDESLTKKGRGRQMNWLKTEICSGGMILVHLGTEFSASKGDNLPNEGQKLIRLIHLLEECELFIYKPVKSDQWATKTELVDRVVLENCEQEGNNYLETGNLLNSRRIFGT